MGIIHCGVWPLYSIPSRYFILEVGGTAPALAATHPTGVDRRFPRSSLPAQTPPFIVVFGPFSSTPIGSMIREGGGTAPAFLGNPQYRTAGAAESPGTCASQLD